MYLKSGEDYYLASLPGIELLMKSGLIITSPNIKFRLLSFSELNKVETMLQAGMNTNEIDDEITQTCVAYVIGFENEEIDFDNCIAFITSHLASKIFLNSKHLVEDLEKTYNNYMTTIGLVDQVMTVVSYYTNTPYKEVKSLPIDELLKRYTVCSTLFPNVPPIIKQEIQESKVG